MRKRKEPMEEQNRVNEENGRNIQTQETEVVTGRKNVDKEAIRKMGTQEEIVTKLKPAEEKNTQKKRIKKND